jgi:phage terminase large subunit-like protein
MEASRLIGLKNQAKKEGWLKYIRTAADENALLNGYTFSFDHYDVFRYYIADLKLGDGEWDGQPFVIQNYQDLICGSLFGWIDEKTGYRRFRKGYIEIPKKNGKSTLVAAIGLFMFDGDGEAGAQVYNVANDREQAGIVWKIAADMLESSPRLLNYPDGSERIKVLASTKILKLAESGSIFKAWSSDQTSKDGPNIHCAIIDELHEWKGKAAQDFWNKIYFGGRVRRQPLCPLVITTAGDDKNSLCFAQHEYARQIIDGRADSDFKYFAMIYGVDNKKIDSDPNYWKSEDAWKESNPGYGTLIKKETFLNDIVEAENNPTTKQAFLRYCLGYWIQAGDPWMPIHVWDACGNETYTEDSLAGQICYGGMDLSATDDFTSTQYVFPYMGTDAETGELVRKYKRVGRIYIPEERLHDRLKLNVNFLTWVEKGYIRMTPGNVIDHTVIFDDIKADAKKFNIKQIAYDRYAAAWIVQQMQQELSHIELFPVSQSLIAMSNPTKALYTAILQKRLEHNNDPVMKWSVGNAVPHTDHNGNIMLHKGKSNDKIDPVVALILAFNQANLGELSEKPKNSIYGSSFAEKIKRLEGIDV